MQKIKTKLTALFLIACLAIPQSLFAQDNSLSFEHIYDSELFQWNYNMFGGLILNYQNQTSGIFFGLNNHNMREALLSYPDSAREYKAYRTKNIWGNGLLWGGLALSMIASLVPLFAITPDSSLDDDARMWRISLGVSVTGLVAAIAGAIAHSSGQESIFTAVNMHNRNRARELSR